MKKQAITILSRLFSILVIAASLAACNHKELGEPDTPEPVPAGSVRVVFDWSEAPDADPAGMRVHFYEAGSGRHVYFDLPAKEGGVIDIQPGEWHIISYNNDSEIVVSANEHDFLSHLLTSRPGNPLESVTGDITSLPRRQAADEDVMPVAEMMWGESRPGHQIEILPGKETTVTITPRELLCRYSYEIRHVSNLSGVTAACAALSGMAGAMYPASEQLHPQPVTLSLPAGLDGDSTIRGEFITFGHHPDNEEPHRMNLYVWMADGSKYVYGLDSYRFDVTSQIHSAPDRRRVHIIIDGLDLPEIIEQGNGYRPSADDWLNEHHEIEI